jgi:hypothetical protein
MSVKNNNGRWLRNASLKRVNMLVMNKKEILSGMSFCTDINADDLEPSGLTSVERYHLKRWVNGIDSGRHCFLAILEHRTVDSDLTDLKMPITKDMLGRNHEFSILSQSISLPNEFLCDSGYLFERVFNKSPSSVVKEGLQLLAAVAMEKSSSALNVEQINLGMKQMKVNNLGKTNNTDKDKDEIYSNDENVNTIQKNKVAESHDAETYRLQILIELIRMHIVSKIHNDSNSSNIDMPSFTKEKPIIEEEPDLKNDKPEIGLIIEQLEVPIKHVVEHAESLSVDDLEASNALLKPYIRQLSSLKARLSTQLKDMENSKAYFVLGIGKDASSADIRKAYHSKAVKLHPDKPGGDTAKFQKLQDMYQEVLKQRKDDAFSDDLDTDNPMTEAEKKLASEFVLDMETILEDEIKDSATQCGRLAQYSMQWQKLVDAAGEMGYPKAVKRLHKLISAQLHNTEDDKGQEDKNLKKKDKKLKLDITMHSCSGELGVAPMEKLCDALQRLAGSAMQLPSCGTRYGISTARNPLFMKLVEQVMGNGLSALKTIASLVTVEEQLQSAIQRLVDSKNRAISNEDVHDVLAEMIVTAFRSRTMTISMVAEKAVAAAVVAAELCKTAKELIKSTNEELKEEKRRAASMRETEQEYSCDEDRAFMAEKKKKEEESERDNYKKQREEKDKENQKEEEKGKDCLDQLRTQIRSLQVQLRVQHIQALQSLNVETREMQKNLQNNLLDIVRENADDVPKPTESNSIPAIGVKSSLLSLLADFIDGSCNSLRTEFTNNVMHLQKENLDKLLNRHLGWMCSLGGDGGIDILTKETNQDGTNNNENKNNVDENDASIDANDVSIDIDKIDIDIDEDSPKKTEKVKPSESTKIETEENEANEKLKSIRLALIPDFRAKTLWMSVLLDNKSVEDIILNELRPRLLRDCIVMTPTEIDATEEAATNSFCQMIIRGISESMLEVSSVENKD